LCKIRSRCNEGPLSSIEGLLKHPLTDIGLAKFLADQKETLKRFLLFNTKAEILSWISAFLCWFRH
jgi:hypothetical protein